VIRLATIVLGILAVGVVVYCVYYYRIELGLVRPQSHPDAVATPPPASSSPPATLAANQPGQVTWQTINRPADGFRIDLPCGITETRLPAYAAKGTPQPVETIEASPTADTTFAVSWADNPPVERAGSHEAQRTLDLAVSGALQRTGTALVSQTDETFGGYPARDFTARSDSGVVVARLIVVQTRLYLLLAAFPGSTGTHEDDVSRFFNSFTLTTPSGSN